MTRIRACAICREPAVEGRIFCPSCDREYEDSREHARAAVALGDFVRRRRAERAKAAPAKAKLTSGEIKDWGRAPPTQGGYKPPDPPEES